MTPFPFLTGDLARGGTGLVPLGMPGRDAIPLANLMAQGAVDRLVGGMVQPLGGDSATPDRRAMLSLWSRYYFYTLIPPVVLTLMLAHRRLPLAAGDGAVLLKPDGLPEAIALPHGGDPCAAPRDPFDRFAPLMRDHLAPLIAHWSAEGKLSQKVLWANAAGYFAWIVREAAATPGIDPEAAFAGTAVVEATHLPDGSANPLHDPMHTLDGPAGPQRWRRTCCLLYRLPDRQECPYCPLLLRGGRCAGPNEPCCTDS
ncbi:siderophore-iron reductase FhuF [Pseudoroseomonas deserti]|uniref:Siderophore-iron reductase FhuF n=1 Tax=Teichococcus deserti TaxID=1817963 RepID=A0A1V2H2B2_9PROT|nr:siderophore-iron reductase FhuF [Pseudoroseomonas deserti]ONG51653.1 siderophore-iron reductase FhuF [Pseudoroseomonas deserti]